jgi:hypothetical protein
VRPSLDLLVAESWACIDVAKMALHAKQIAVYANRTERPLAVMKDNTKATHGFRNLRIAGSGSMSLRHLTLLAFRNNHSAKQLFVHGKETQ